MNDLEAILDECIRAMASGELTLDGCLTRHPEHAAELRPMLVAAMRVASVPPIAPSPEFRRRAREQLAAQMASDFRPVARRPRLAWMPARQMASLMAALTLVFVFAGTAAAQVALPGEPLYGLKRLSEIAWLGLPRSAEDQLAAQLAIAERRLDEAERLAADPIRAAKPLEDYKETVETIQEFAIVHPELAGHAEAELAEQAERLQHIGAPLPTELAPILTPQATQPVIVPVTVPPVLPTESPPTIPLPNATLSVPVPTPAIPPLLP